MISDNIHIEIPQEELNLVKLNKGIWLTVLHINRIPPHIGILFDGKYFSLTIKGKELDLDLNVLVKTIQQKKIASTFIKVKEHPVFSTDHICSIFKEQLNQYEQVKQHDATCLSPIKQCFNEFYAMNSEEEELFFEFMQKLFDNKFILSYMSLNYQNENGLELPSYTQEILNEKIKNERKPYYND